MTLHIDFLRTNSRVSPLGIDSPCPEFSWRLSTEENTVRQRGYELQVATTEHFDDSLVWQSGHVASELPFGAKYGGPQLHSMQRYWWRVRAVCAVDANAQQSDAPPRDTGWSEATWFETAVLDPALWKARWIGGRPPSSKSDDPVLYLRSEVELSSDIVRARAYVSALGWYRLFVNGVDMTGDALVPRWTPASEVVEYQTYDVTSALHAGKNIVGIAVGDGRYRGGLGLTGTRETYGKETGGFAQFEIELAEGTTHTLVTDDRWYAGRGRITGSDPRTGERADLRISDTDWRTASPAPRRFARARTLTRDLPLIAEEVERVRAIDRLDARVGRAPSGAQILDFGQNFAGVVRIRLTGASGTVLQLTHAELVTAEGELDTKSFLFHKQWYQRETVVLAGGEEWYQPWFTIHGFRYVEVIGLDHDLDPTDVEGVVLSTDIATTGTFRCSDSRLEQLHRNVLWSVRSNFVDTPTDCPTRERSGWTGDIQAFAPTAAVLVDSQAFLSRYLRNLILEQFDDGAVAMYVPSQQPIEPSIGRKMLHIISRSVGWSDAAVLLPWTVYRYYGDRSLLERQYESMRLRVDGMERRARTKGRGRYLLDSGFHFGEWLRPGETPLTTMMRHLVRRPAEIATAYFAQSADVVARAAEELGKDDDAARYRTLTAHVRDTWRKKFVHPDGRLAMDRQDDYVRALAFGLLLPEQRPAAVARLVELITSAGDHIGTGFLSTPMIMHVLVEGGRPDVALRLLFQTDNPSWLHQIARGATTVWETWEGYDDAGNGKESHNHYALGSIAGWLTEGLGGLTPAAPGYRHIRIAPVLAQQLSFVESMIDTPFGVARSAWRREDDRVILEVTVPPGATAQVIGPWTGDTAAADGVIGSGRHVFLADF